MIYKLNSLKLLFTTLILTILLVVLDQLTKFFAVKNLMNQADLIIIPGVFQLHYLENIGAAFSILRGKQTFFLIITPIMLVAMIYILFKMPKQKKFEPLNWIIIFTIAGAIGNYIDRFRFGYVVDFLYFSLINFPVFNVADCYVTCSVILLIILILFYYKEVDFDQLHNSLLKK